MKSSWTSLSMQMRTLYCLEISWCDYPKGNVIYQKKWILRHTKTQNSTIISFSSGVCFGHDQKVGLYHRGFLVPGLISWSFCCFHDMRWKTAWKRPEYFYFQPAALSCYFSFIAFILRSFINISLSTELFILNLGDFSPLFCERSVPVYLKNDLVYVIFFCGPGSLVGIETDYGLDGPGSTLGRDEIFRPSRPALGPTQPPVKWVPGLSRG